MSLDVVSKHFNIKSYRRHPLYSSTSKVHDIGLIKLLERVSYSDVQARPICLPTADNSKSFDENYSLAGWSILTGPKVMHNSFFIHYN